MLKSITLDRHFSTISLIQIVIEICVHFVESSLLSLLKPTSRIQESEVLILARSSHDNERYFQ